jgi:predicted phosphate transport protein (TIGR00153 family)
MSGLAEWFKTRSDSILIQKTREHALKVNQVVHEAQEFIYKTFQGKTPEGIQKRTEKSEHEADILRREISSILVKEKFQPNEREDMMRFIKRMDNVANNANTSVRRMALFKTEKIPDELKNLILKMLMLALECSDLLKDCTIQLGEVDISEILKLTDRIGTIEHQVDLVNSEVKSFLIKSNITEDPFEALLIYEFIERIESIADSSEEAADIIKLIALRDQSM